MPTQEADAPETAGNAAQPVSMESAFNSALQTLEQGNGEQPADQTVAPEPSGNAEQPVDEPEHVKWAKAYDGLTDKDTGQINVDRLAKQAFELNKMAQTNAQRLNQLDALLNLPEVAQALLKVSGRVPVQQDQPPEVPETDKTDEQVLDEWVMERVNKALAPLRQENQVLFAEYAKSQIQGAYSQLKEEFGTDEAGKPLYDSVKEEVGRQIYAAAQQVGIPYEQFTNELIRRGLLYQTLSTTARTILYPKLQQRVTQIQNKNVQDKKRVVLPAKGTTATVVNPVEKRVSSILEAARQAEEQHPEFKNLV